MTSTKKFDARAFISITLLISAVILPISIFMRHMPVFEHSRQAEHLFTSVHAATGLIFTIILILHVIMNRHALKKYLVRNNQNSTRKYVFTAVAFVFLLLALISTWDFLIQ